MITDRENSLRNKFFDETQEKAYTGFINDNDKVIWKENYVKFLEEMIFKLEDELDQIKTEAIKKYMRLDY